MEDLQFIADQKGISLQEAIDRHAWNDNFSLAVSRIREAAPETFAGAEIVDGANAWIAFTGRPPEAALAIVELFRSSHSSVSVEVRTNRSVTEAELQDAIRAVHSAVREAQGVRIAFTSFDSATAQIESTVVLESAASDSILDAILAIATERLIAVTRPDILDSISVSVVLGESLALGGVDGPVLTSPPPDRRFGGMDGIVRGIVVFDESTGCLYLGSHRSENRKPVVWPAGASWQADPPAVRLQGYLIEPGMSVYGGGGYVPYKFIKAVAGIAVADAARVCAEHADPTDPTDDVAFFNIGSEVDVVP